MNTVLKIACDPAEKVKEFFYRFEFQQRGSPHIHMLVWIENAPTLEKNSEEEIVQFVDKYLTCNIDNVKYSELQKTMNEHKDNVDMSFDEFLEKVS